MPYHKSTKTNYSGIQFTSYKFKNIIVTVNGETFIDDKVGPSGRRIYENWFNITGNGLFYLCYEGGRLYFFNNKTNLIDISCCDDETQMVNFIYKGEWEKETDDGYKMEYQEIPVCVEFVEKRDYKKFKDLMNGNF